MGFHLRKSIKCGPIRFNLSNSGVGFSTGVKGLRVGVDAKGRSYIGGGVGMLRYRKTSRSTSSTSAYVAKDEIPTELINLYVLNIVLLVLFSPLFIMWPFTLLGLFDKNIGFAPLIILSIPCLLLLWSFKIGRRNNKISKGIKAYNNQEYDLALSLLEPFMDFKFKTSEATQFIRNIILNAHIETEAFEKAIEFTKSRYVYNSREKVALCLYKLEKFEDLLKHLQKEYSEEDKQQHPSIYAMLGTAFLKLGHKEVALETMLSGPTAKRKMDDELCAFRYTLGECYEVNGDIKNALKQYEKVFAFDVEYEDVKNKIENLKG